MMTDDPGDREGEAGREKQERVRFQMSGKDGVSRKSVWSAVSNGAERLYQGMTESWQLRLGRRVFLLSVSGTVSREWEK